MGQENYGVCELENDVARYERQVTEFIEATESARRLSEKVRDYLDLKQWSAEEEATLRQRGQAPVVFDYMREQLDYFLGMERSHRSDPRAYPRTQQHEGAADACSDALRYIADKNDFSQTASDAFEDMMGPGYGVAIVEAEREREGYEITIRHIPWDRFYFDPHSRRKDFKDAGFMGIMLWLDESDAVAMYKGKEDAIRRAISGEDGSVQGSTLDDKLSWTNKDRRRIRVCQHYFREGGKWYLTHFSGKVSLVDAEPCKLLDDEGEPECPIEAQSAFIDRENNRYGYMLRLLAPQDEVNHRRSKALHLLSNRQVLAEEGVVADQGAAQSELNKPRGWVTVRSGALANQEIQISQTGDMAQGQLAMYQDAVAKMASTGANSAMQGEVGGMSGAAIGKLQAGGQIQVGPVYDAHRAWKKRIYRQVWNRVKQFWDAPMWIRVTDDEQNLKWVGLNQPITVGSELLRAAKAGDQEAAQRLQQAMAVKDPQLAQPIGGEAGTENAVAEIDVDIIIDESPDTLTAQEDQFKMLAELAKVYGPQAVPFKALIELSAMPNKRRVLDLLGGEGQDPAAAQMAQMQAQLQQMTAQLQMQEAQARSAKLAAEARKIDAQAEQVEMETQLVRTLPDITPNVNI